MNASTDGDPTYEEVTRAVYASLEDLLVRREKFQHASVPLLELISGDEVSFCFIPDTDKALGVKTTQEDWDGVITLQEVIELYVRLVKRRGEFRPDETQSTARPSDAEGSWLARLFRWAWLPLLPLSLACGSPAPRKVVPAENESAGSRVRTLVASELTAGQAAWRETYGVIPPSGVTLEALPPSRGVRLWRAAGPLDHWQSYVVSTRVARHREAGGRPAWCLGEGAARRARRDPDADPVAAGRRWT